MCHCDPQIFVASEHAGCARDRIVRLIWASPVHSAGHNKTRGQLVSCVQRLKKEKRRYLVGQNQRHNIKHSTISFSKPHTSRELGGQSIKRLLPPFNMPLQPSRTLYPSGYSQPLTIVPWNFKIPLDANLFLSDH